MREEKVTIHLLNWLERNEWKIVCYDFPQSGTGVMLHPNFETTQSTKNKGGIIPDILAIRGSICLFFENKDRFVMSDFEKVKAVKQLGNYSYSLNKLLAPYNINKIYYGIGIPSIEKDVQKSLDNIYGLDFLISTDIDGNIKVDYDSNGILSA